MTDVRSYVTDHQGDLLADLDQWLLEREYDSIQQLRGSMSQRRVAEPAAFERAHYLRTIGTFSLASTLAIDGSAATYGFEATPTPPPD